MTSVFLKTRFLFFLLRSCRYSCLETLWSIKNKLKEVNLNLNQNPGMVWGFYSDCFCWHPHLTLEARIHFSKLNAGHTSREGLVEATRLTPQVPTGTASIPLSQGGHGQQAAGSSPLLSTFPGDRQRLPSGGPIPRPTLSSPISGLAS